MNHFMVLLEEIKGSNLPKVGQFGKLLVHLSLNAKVNLPPTDAQFNDGLNVVHVTTHLCEVCLQEKLETAGFETTVGQTGGLENDCPNHKALVAAE